MKNKEEVYREIEGELGFVPSFFKRLSEETLNKEWKLFHQQLDDEYGTIPPKYRELMGVAVAAALQCPYCVNAHTQFSQKLYGASDEEIEEAVHTAKHTAGWSSYIRGLGTDIEEFKKEITQACENVQKKL